MVLLAVGCGVVEAGSMLFLVFWDKLIGKIDAKKRTGSLETGQPTLGRLHKEVSVAVESGQSPLGQSSAQCSGSEIHFAEV